MSDFFLTLAGICMIANLSCFPAADNSKLMDHPTILQQLSERDSKVLQEFESHRLKLTRSLIKNVSDSKNLDERINSAVLLGKLRASEAIEVLIANIQLSPLGWDEKTFEIVCPCGGALIRIGSSARKAVLVQLRTESDASRHRLLSIVLKEIEGYDVAEFLLILELKNAADDVGANLNQALKMIREWREKTGKSEAPEKGRGLKQLDKGEF